MENRTKKSVGNTTGFEGGENLADPLFKKTFMCPASLQKLLVELAYKSKNKISHSELIRQALIKTYGVKDLGS